MLVLENKNSGINYQSIGRISFSFLNIIENTKQHRNTNTRKTFNDGLGQGGNGSTIMVQFHTDPKFIKRSVIQLWQVTTTLINF